MIKIFVNFIVTILFSLLLINPQSIAHHKENSNYSKRYRMGWKKETKKDFENQAKQQYCAYSAKQL